MPDGGCGTCSQESAATVKGEVQRSNAAVAHHQSKVAELKVVLQNKDWERDEALRTQKEEYDAVRQTLEARLREREEELETQVCLMPLMPSNPRPPVRSSHPSSVVLQRPCVDRAASPRVEGSGERSWQPQ